MHYATHSLKDICEVGIMTLLLATEKNGQQLKWYEQDQIASKWQS